MTSRHLDNTRPQAPKSKCTPRGNFNPQDFKGPEGPITHVPHHQANALGDSGIRTRDRHLALGGGKVHGA
eukprot:3473448-Pyramimonas_sp.AAC.1